jgi:hypothetical protein
LGNEGKGASNKKMTSFSNIAGPSYKQYKFNSVTTSSINDPTMTEVMVKEEPKDMQGILGLWKIAIDCKEAKVGESVASLLLQLHTNVDFGMENMIPIYEDQFVTSCLKIIREQLDVIQNRTPEEL